MKASHRLSPPGIRLQLMLWYSAVSAALILLSATFFLFKNRTG
jgi:hypothetical protein